MSKLEKLLEFVRIAELAERIEDSGAEPEIIYDLIFSNEVSGAVSDLDMVPRHYCDPDTTYEEDVRAYVRALREDANEYRKIVGALVHDGATDD